MRHLLLSCALLLAALPLGAASAATIEVRVTNVGATGTLRVAVCDRERYLKACPYSASVAPQAGQTTVTLKDIPPGTWAVLAYQDENENKQLDRNFIGIPTENYGFSRDAVGRFGPPEFEEAAIEVRDGTTVAPIALH
ncbi:DUF2141 domain-containing protein [Massilia sp. MS-15]|uniref:DUF2141 domain-containing protein n=1 Tax=Massilia sp. MS-15 TaxID=2878200 RepID=UPI001CD271F3|nr:DUF2141 domain-containing protein [Massilia sp. MS-15]MCA1247109.1 DUF2141 domain-containing protein [Massilia sp. MS-15]